MLRAFGSRYQNCDGITRRNFLELGASVLGLSLADVLRLRSAAAAENPDRGKSNKALIVFWTHGGLSQKLLKQSASNIEALYRDGGYEEIKVTPRTIDRGSKIDVDFDIEEGTRAYVYQDGDAIVLKPITPKHIKSLRGSLKGAGVLKALMDDRKREREL